MSVKSKMTALADAIRAKTGETAPLSIDGMTRSICGLQVNGSDDLAKGLISGEATSLVIPPDVTRIRSHGCSYLKITSVVVPETITWIGTYAFQHCDNLTSAVVNCNELGGYMFFDCTSLSYVKFSPQLSNIPNAAFQACYSLESIDLPQSLLTIGGSAFGSCRSLQSITIPAGTQTIGLQAFYACSALTSIALPASLKTISDNAFSACYNIADVQLGQGFCASLNLSASKLLTPEVMVPMLTALCDRTGDTTLTLALGKTNLDKLNTAEIQIATDKNWTLA